MNWNEPFELTTKAVITGLFVGNIYWLKKLLTKINSIGKMQAKLNGISRRSKEQAADIKALRELTFNINGVVKYIEGRLKTLEDQNG